MSEATDELADGVQRWTGDLHSAALGFLEEGLRLLHQERGGGLRQQVAVGVLGVATELFLKAFIARQHITLVFKGLPSELQAALLAPATVPRTIWYPHLVRFRAGEFELIEFGKAIDLFFYFRPERREELKVHLDAVSRARNLSLHSLLPERLAYELNRAGYVAIEIGKMMLAPEAFTEQDEQFLSNFRAERTLKVSKAVSEATKKAKTVAGPFPPLVTSGWSEFAQACPICGAPALLRGESRLEGVKGKDGDISDTVLMFYATGIECSHCGLRLDDGEELREAGIEADIDRDDEDMRSFLAAEGAGGTVHDPAGRPTVHWQVMTDPDGGRRTIVRVLGHASVYDYTAETKQAMAAAVIAKPYPLRRGGDGDDER